MITRQSTITPAGILLIILLSVSNCAQAGNHSYEPGQDSSKSLHSALVKDNPIIAMLDSLAQLTFKEAAVFTSGRDQLNIYKYSEDYVPVFDDEVYQSRLAKMNSQSPFEFRYNALVRQYIDLYATRKRGLTQRILGLSGVYFPLFEEQLDRFNLPLELKYLAVIESALNPVARSHAGAKGLWQFMYNTGKQYDLKVSSYVDDRNDPYKATIAACQHLKDLYDIYHDWSLVLAAYNSGAGNVNRAIRKSGGVMDFWTIMRFLPRETRDYVPAFIAASYVMHHAAEHNLYPVHPGILHSEIDTVTVNQVLTFDQLSESLNIPLDNLRFLNPAYTKDLIPASADKTYILRLPVSYVADFVNNEETIYSFKSQKGLEREQLLAQVKDVQERSVTHVVRKGETLAKIARKYHCSVSELKKWNGIKKDYVKANQVLVVYGAQPTKSKTEKNTLDSALAQNDKSGPGTGSKNKSLASQEDLIGPPPMSEFIEQGENNKLAGTGNKSKKQTDSKYIYHTIRHGDTLWGIANKYQGVTVEQIKKLNQISNAKHIKPGQKIKIALGEG